MSKLQDSFDSRPGDFRLEPGEYEGPLVITRPCVVDGGMSTLWANSGPVLRIEAAGVTIRNLRVEVTGEGGAPESRTAIQTEQPDTKLTGVEVSGDVRGFPHEAPVWDLPPLLALGSFAAEQENSFSFRLSVPADAGLSCSLKDVRISPSRLVKGENLLFLETGAIRDRTILYGEILVTTSVTRRIYITGKAQADAPKHQAEPPLAGKLPVSEPVVIDTPQELIAPPAPDAVLPAAVKGQRMPVKEFGPVLKAVFTQEGLARPVDIDSYVFLLQENGRVRGDSDLVFFGNPATQDGAIQTASSQEGPLVIVDLDRAEPWVSKIAVAFSIYGDDPSETFSLVKAPSIRLLAGERDCCRFDLSGLRLEKTVVALELYRYKGEWRIQFVGAGYHSGLKKLCESYGVEVE